MDAEQIERSLWAFDGIAKTHQQALAAHKAEIIRARKTAADLRAALDQERIQRAAVEQKLHSMILDSDVTERAISSDVEKLADHVTALDQSMAVQIRKSAAPRTTVAKTTPVRDDKGRVIATATLDPARPDIAVIRRVIRDDQFRITGSETYEVELEPEDEDRSQPNLIDANDPEAIAAAEAGL